MMQKVLLQLFIFAMPGCQVSCCCYFLSRMIRSLDLSNMAAIFFYIHDCQHQLVFTCAHSFTY